jgi:hypothetical protein
MTIQKPVKTILCTWELGGELGHISNLSAVAKALEVDGYRVVVALRDLSRAYPFFCDTKVTLLQAPVWLPVMKMQRPIACLADTLLLSGYLETDPLHCLVKVWQSLVDQVQPDLVIFDYSPTAMLAMLYQSFPKILVGSGFADPVPGHPIADWRPYATQDKLIERQEQQVLKQINTVLERQQKPQLSRMADLFRATKVIVRTFPELDLYENIRQDADYAVGQTTTRVDNPVRFSNSGRRKILAYIKPGYPQIDRLIGALARVDAEVFVACPGGQATLFQTQASETFQFSVELVDLRGAMAEADLFLGHGNSSSVKESLLAQTPVVVLPIQLEQLLTGKRLQALGFGALIEEIRSEEELLSRLNSFLSNSNDYRTAIGQLLTKYPEPRLPLSTLVKAACAELLAL